MKMYTKSFNSKLELATFVNEKGIAKKDIISVFQESDQLYTLIYYGE